MKITKIEFQKYLKYAKSHQTIIDCEWIGEFPNTRFINLIRSVWLADRTFLDLDRLSSADLKIIFKNN